MIAPPRPYTESYPEPTSAAVPKSMRPDDPSPFVLRRDWYLLFFTLACFLMLLLIGLKDLLLGLLGWWRGA
jgi:hypothetical protein